MDGTVVLCQAGSAAAFRARASTAWEGGTPACFVVARGITLRYSACGACLCGAEFETGREIRWVVGSCGSPDPSLARRESSMRTLRAINLAACKALEGAAKLLELAGLARLHSWCTGQEKASLD